MCDKPRRPLTNQPTNQPTLFFGPEWSWASSKRIYPRFYFFDKISPGKFAFESLFVLIFCKTKFPDVKTVYIWKIGAE